MCTLQQPWADVGNIEAARLVVNGTRPELPADLDPGYGALIQVRCGGCALWRPFAESWW